LTLGVLPCFVFHIAQDRRLIDYFEEHMYMWENVYGSSRDKL